MEFSDTFVTSAPRGAPRRTFAGRTLVAALVAALLVPLAAVAVGAPAVAAETKNSAATTSTTASPAPAPSAVGTTPTTAAPITVDSVVPADPVAADQPADGVNTVAYAGAPWFKPGVAYNANFPDPTVTWDGTRYWAYATSTGGSLMPAMSSTDLKTWIPRPAYSPNPYNADPFFNDSFPVPPSWTMGGTNRSGKAQWAPGVVSLAGRWIAYTSWEVAPGRRCISVASASSPAGPFVDNNPGPLVCDSDPGGSIDPQPFIDSNGQPYLLWKSAGVPGSAPTKIKSRALSGDGLSFAPGSSPVAILETGLPWDGNSIENPSMIKHGGVYWLIYSGNEWESANYRMGQAACAGPLGPCGRTSDSPLIQNTATEWSPGGGTLFTDTSGRLRIIYQVWNAPYTSYPTNPNCDRANLCASQGQRFYRIDGVAVSNGRLSVDPIGSLDMVTASQGAVTIGGWALDPSDPASIAVHVYIDGVGTAITASGSRPDLAASYPGLGTAHGFNATIPAAPGAHTLCAYGINNGAGANVAIGCRPIFVPGTSPFGSFDSVVSKPGEVGVNGWAIDPDTSSPIAVHVYVDNIGTAITAGNARSDLGTLYPASGPNHGFSATIPTTGGFHNVCAYAINVAGGANVSLGCKLVIIPGGSPYGSLDMARGVPGGVLVGGWAIDPDTVGPDRRARLRRRQGRGHHRQRQPLRRRRGLSALRAGPRLRGHRRRHSRPAQRLRLRHQRRPRRELAARLPHGRRARHLAVRLPRRRVAADRRRVRGGLGDRPRHDRPDRRPRLRRLHRHRPPGRPEPLRHRHDLPGVRPDPRLRHHHQRPGRCPHRVCLRHQRERRIEPPARLPHRHRPLTSPRGGRGPGAERPRSGAGPFESVEWSVSSRSPWGRSPWRST